MLAALIAVQQNDIKRIIAYSTLSQLGYMVMAVGLNGPTPAMFHLTTHAFFKALLFLSAGSVILGMHHEQDIWQMGNLRKKMPVTFWTFLIGALALSGIPPFSGFYSKDSIFAQCLEQKNYLLFGVAVFVAALTAFYTFRLFFVVFFGKEKSEHAKHAHESVAVITLPLIVLAIFAVIGGVIGAKEIYRHHFFDAGHFQFISPANNSSAEAAEWNLAQIALAAGNITSDKAYSMVFPAKTLLQKIFEPFTDAPGVAILGLSVVAIGFFMARKFYLNAETDPLPAKLGWLSRAMKNRFYFDEIYEATFIRAHDFIATVADWIDRWLVEGFCIGAIRGGTDLSGRALRLMQTGNLQTYAFLFVLGVAVLLYFVLGK